MKPFDGKYLKKDSFDARDPIFSYFEKEEVLAKRSTISCSPSAWEIGLG
jgi:hypothetical protein